jgi:hypothetical protein
MDNKKGKRVNIFLPMHRVIIYGLKLNKLLKYIETELVMDNIKG